MATYLQWSRKKPLRRVTWVCGPEPVLVREVVAAHREGAPPGQCTAVFAGDAPERGTWDLLLSDPPPGGRRTVVYEAERLKGTGNLALLAAEGADTAYTVFVSGEPDFRRDDGKLAPHLAALQASKAAQLIRCCEPSKAGDRTALVASWWPGATLTFAYDVLTRCGSLERAYLACEQARLAGLVPSRKAAAAVCPAEPGSDFADLLMAGDRRGAALAAGRLSASGLGAAIGLLASWLTAAEQVSTGSREHADQFTARRVLPYADAYPADRIRRCRRALAVADSAWRGGARAGVAESLAACW
jgi:hypothetical protein